MALRIQRKFIPWIIHHSIEFKWQYLGAFTCLYILQIFQSEIPERIRQLTQQMGLGKLGDVSVWIFVGLAFGILFFRTFSRLLFFYPARVQQKLLRMELLELLETVPSSRYKEKSQGQIFQILFDDINNLRAFVGFGLLQIGNLIIAGWVLVPKLNQTDAYLWPAFSPLFASVGLFTIMTFINQRFFKKMMDKKGEVQQYIIESYEAKQTIKNFHREDNFIKGFFKISGEELSLFFKSSIGFAITGPYVKLGLGASLIWASLLIRKQGGDTSDLVFFSGFLYLFLEPVMFMSWVAVVVSQGLAAWKRVKELHALVITPSLDEKELHGKKAVVDDQNIKVSLNYWNKDISFNFNRGAWTSLVGETGSGKSFVLTKIATSLILDHFKVSMVQQEPYLFNDTIQENIFLGRTPDQSSMKKAEELLRIFHLDNLGSTIEEVLKLEVGENGKRLSGGQIKRVALIRSLLSGANILIWDDPFSSVDIILEKKIMARLRTIEGWNQLTFIISSHRLTTVRLSDQVIFISPSEGIVSDGDSDKVLKEENVIKFFKEQMVDLSLD
jgi:ATP-binding cassette subfamily B multidrug efflux pump